MRLPLQVSLLALVLVATYGTMSAAVPAVRHRSHQILSSAGRFHPTSDLMRAFGSQDPTEAGELLAASSSSFIDAQGIGDSATPVVPRRHAAGLARGTDAAIVEQYECEVLPLGGAPPPGVASLCYHLQVPLEYSDPAQGNITIFVRRTFVDAPGRGNVLWMLPGGSGVPSWHETSIAAPLVYGLNKIGSPVDVLMYDKRGTGNSSYIGCPYPMLTEADKCLQYLAANPAVKRIFSSVTYTNTALDIKAGIDALTDWESGTQKVFVMGSSNGAYLVQRYMQLAPTQADAIVLDALLPPDLFRLVHNQINMDTLGLGVMARCAADDFCRAQFNGSYNGAGDEYIGPMQALEALKLSGTFGGVPCLEKLNITYLEMAESLANLLYVDTWSLTPPAVKRLLRCNKEDEAVLAQFMKLTTPPPEGADTPAATILVEARNDWSELWTGPGSPDYECGIITGFHIDSFFANNIASTECPARDTAKAGGFLYTPDPSLYEHYSAAQVPTLAMNGQMDQAVPVGWARHAAAQYRSVNQEHFVYVEMPFTAHVPSTQSPVSNNPTSCGFQILISFLLSPTHVPNLACLPYILPVDFAGKTPGVQAAAKQYFGADLWGTDALPTW